MVTTKCQEVDITVRWRVEGKVFRNETVARKRFVAWFYISFVKDERESATQKSKIGTDNVCMIRCLTVHRSELQ